MCMHIFSLQKSIVNLSEESQLEAAITASLQESEPNNSDTPTLIFSDDSDTECLSPDRRTEDPQRTVRSVGKSSLHTEEMKSGDRDTEAATGFNGVTCSTTAGTSKTRKRPSNNVGSEWPGKRRRMDMDPVCSAMDSIELTRSLSEEESLVRKKPLNGKGKRAKGGKGKGKAVGGCGQEAGVSTPEDCCSMRGCCVEDLLAAGDIHKEDVSLILFRLPDGTRLQKTFLSNHPIRVSPSMQEVSYPKVVCFMHLSVASSLVRDTTL